LADICLNFRLGPLGIADHKSLKSIKQAASLAGGRTATAWDRVSMCQGHKRPNPTHISTHRIPCLNMPSVTLNGPRGY
jgi:hypothetical protein